MTYSNLKELRKDGKFFRGVVMAPGAYSDEDVAHDVIVYGFRDKTRKFVQGFIVDPDGWVVDDSVMKTWVTDSQWSLVPGCFSALFPYSWPEDRATFFQFLDRLIEAQE